MSGTLPKEVAGLIKELIASSVKRRALESAILAALDAAREGALKPARDLFAALDLTCPGWKEGTMVPDGDEVNDAWRALDAALASRPSPAAEPATVPREWLAEVVPGAPDVPVVAPEPAPESEGLPCPVCDDGIEGPCPRCTVPSPRSTPEDR